MASNKKNTKLLTRLLAVLLVAIWGEVAYQLFFHKSDGSAANTPLSVTSLHEPAREQVKYVFKDNVRDPFAYIHPTVIARQKKKPVPLIVHHWSPPLVSFEGVILGNGRRTAILTDMNGQTHFLSRGDTLAGVRILRINDKEVEYDYEKKDTIWSVPR